MPIVSYGPFTFASGWLPQAVTGPSREGYVVEHQVPGREGGVVEYVGSRQSTYQLRGFLAPTEVISDNAGAVLSGASYLGLNSDDAKEILLGLRGSGAQLLKIESSLLLSGNRLMYENDFFYARNITIAMEAGKSYPYYPYTMDLQRASTKTYGNSSGTNLGMSDNSGNFFSGYIRSWLQRSGMAQGELVIGMGMYVVGVASGNARVAVYDLAGTTLLTESASQAVHSGWNYFPLRPSFTTTSGTRYELAFKANVATWSGFNVRYLDSTGTSGLSSRQSGITYSDAFPATYAPGTGLSVSGLAWDMVLVTM